ncbi:MAG: serine O-acetyltransferase [Alkalinema sp. CACIAM 70d]|nr:MAG: serine O-acetyltransferase [Alkalinema sp. CACIAM 70d]
MFNDRLHLDRWNTSWRSWHNALRLIQFDFTIIFDREPSAHHWLEVFFCHPGFHALLLHRIAHWLHSCGMPYLPRILSHFARWVTGVEIHPAAVIGQGVCIDHGLGVVIGETAIVGDYAVIYQGVTLGGTGKETGKRHPTIGSHVVLGAGATILGNIQVGDCAKVGAGSIVLQDVPAHSIAVGIPSRPIAPYLIAPHLTRDRCSISHGSIASGSIASGLKPEPSDSDVWIDAEAMLIRSLVDRLEQLEQTLDLLHLNTLADSQSTDLSIF